VCLELLLPTETFHFLSQFHFVNVIYSVVFKNAKYVGAIAAAISLDLERGLPYQVPHIRLQRTNSDPDHISRVWLFYVSRLTLC